MTEEPLKPELLTCPFCGGQALKQYMKEPNLFVECQQCYASSDRFGTDEEIIVVWNRRI